MKNGIIGFSVLKKKNVVAKKKRGVASFFTLAFVQLVVVDGKYFPHVLVFVFEQFLRDDFSGE